jgi:hypothetical protein
MKKLASLAPSSADISAPCRYISTHSSPRSPPGGDMVTSSLLPWHESNLLLPRSKIATLLLPTSFHRLGSNLLFPCSKTATVLDPPSFISCYLHRFLLVACALRYGDMIRKIVWLATLVLGTSIHRSRTVKKFSSLLLCAEMQRQSCSTSGKNHSHDQEKKISQTRVT